jgi:hypothetical protein
MLQEPAVRASSQSSRFTPERLVATVLVAALHLILVWILAEATLVRIAPHRNYHEEPITLWLQTAPKKLQPLPPQPEEKEKKKLIAPPVPNAAGPTIATPPPAAPQTPEEYNGLRALGQYLNDCSAMAYEDMNERDIAHCLRNEWAGPAAPKVGLGAEPASPFKAELDARKKPARQVEHACDQNSLNSNLGLPCYDFAH